MGLKELTRLIASKRNLQTRIRMLVLLLLCTETCFPAGFELTVADGESQSSLPLGLWVQVGASSSDIADC